MSAASCFESFESGKDGITGASVVRNFLTNRRNPILSAAISGARPSLPWRPWHELQLCIRYHLLPFSALPGGAPQPVSKKRTDKRKTLTTQRRAIRNSLDKKPGPEFLPPFDLPDRDAEHDAVQTYC